MMIELGGGHKNSVIKRRNPIEFGWITEYQGEQVPRAEWCDKNRIRTQKIRKNESSVERAFQTHNVGVHRMKLSVAALLSQIMQEPSGVEFHIHLVRQIEASDFKRQLNDDPGILRPRSDKRPEPP
ncbi:hypothetical protein EVAR_98097_1 [Eumeta japonica]|uniref:Uncharacterized protein n=1 Tax=Eumeta variegata TaxID=151549 RepID=A0A4C1XLE5_EUMVA|nr:hypothetical protein EVAR_98097_1 [Eumeta japonica]